MDKSFFSRLQEFVSSKGMSNNEFGRQVGISSAQISHMLNGSKFGVDKLLMIYNRFNDLNLDWLMTGKGKMSKTGGQLNQSESEAIAELKIELQKSKEKIEVLENEVLKLEKELLDLYSKVK